MQRVLGSPIGPDSTAGAARLRVNLANPLFADAVMSDVNLIRRTETGRVLFRRLHDAQRTITIEKPEPPTDPPNAWTLMRDGSSNELVVVYDPSDWPNQAWPNCPPSDVVLFGRLLDATMLTSGTGVGSAVEPTLATYLTERATFARTAMRQA